ncbi:lipoprotein insertase outer membrane protein LolB [Idiomarina xiamenensis]|uniref:Outer-membrane lipoprotein LolB n=1 Tax=Idiomarina xiamenensis 10-D-4 TaxID=740709 RepID=K2KJL9_9GAMM|nr:lipoprotein insertase outer membrane protein LolB [Idiomarina xiamenensis]EKE82784.1 Outer membrane lipoprotein involved in outer membrane biogenesis [Idiomarina xiamenensis 10-D-4]
MRLLICTCLLLLLSACASRPPQPSYQANQVDQHLIAEQQQRLANLNDWQLDGQVAVFDLVADERHAVYLRWQQTATHLSMRFSHPLKGTLATLEASAKGAILTDDEGQQWRDRDVKRLLARVLNLQLPIATMQQLVIGRQPSAAENLHYYQDGHIAELALTLSDQRWSAQLQDYRAVRNDLLKLPHAVELTSPQYRIKVKVSQWTLAPQ